MKKTLICLVFLLVTSFVYLLQDYTTLGTFYFYFLFSYIGINVFISRIISLIDVWNFAFIFIILSEVFSDNFFVTKNHLSSLQYLIVANNIINIGYCSFNKTLKKNRTLAKPKFNLSKYNSYLICFLIGYYFFSKLGRAIRTFSIGRNIVYSNSVNSSFSFLDPFINSIGLVMPAITVYYFTNMKSKTLLFSFILSSPIFLILFLSGTRFPLLFSFIGFLVVSQTKSKTVNSIKKQATIIISLLSLFIATQLMKQYRSSATKDNKIVLLGSDFEKLSIPKYVTSYMSPEGIIDMTSLMFRHFENENHLYGKSNLFITYFWVPRSIWPNKPTMLGHWFVRKYRSNFGAAHSTSFGFTGDLYADFGYFSLFCVFLIGRLLMYAEKYKNLVLSNKNYSTVLAAMLFPYVFFFVRSPITATMNFIGIILIYSFFKYRFISKH